MIQLPDDARHAVEEAIAAGNKIEAIKLYREATGMGLKESKEAVEAMEPQLRAARPELFVGRPVKAGCLGSALLVMVILCVLLLVA